MFLDQNELTAEIERNFIKTLDEYHSQPETWNNALDDQIRRWYLGAKTVFPKRPYFSPSSANSCPLELYVKAKRAKRDIEARQPHQARWQRIGTAIGDIIQRDLLDYEEQETKEGRTPKFRFLRTHRGEPAFEDFAKYNKHVKMADDNGEIVEFYLYGAPDGIMEYVTDDGEVIRVGLEVKSKQTTPARTSEYSMREADEDHRVQVVAYSHMYEVDYYIILYVNAAKKTWHYDTLEDYEKSPDVRAFAYHITDVHRYELLSKLANLQSRINNNDRPDIDPNRWTFNNYKTATVAQLNDKDIEKLRAHRKLAEKATNVRDFVKRNLIEAIDDIIERWEDSRKRPVNPDEDKARK